MVSRTTCGGGKGTTVNALNFRSLSKMATLLVAASLYAAGAIGAGAEELDPPFQDGTAEQRAVKLMQQGVRFRNNGMREEEKAVAAGSDRARDKAMQKARKQYDKAVTKLRAAAQLDQRNDTAFYELGYALHKAGDYRKAVGAFNYALKLDPDLLEAVAMRGEACLALGILDETKKAYTRLSADNDTLANQLMGAIDRWAAARPNPSPTEMEFIAWAKERS